MRALLAAARGAAARAAGADAAPAWPALAGLLAALALGAAASRGYVGTHDAATAWAWHATGATSPAHPGGLGPPPGAAPAALTWWTAALVHLSGWHLLANVMAAAAVAAWGWVAGCTTRSALAWLLAWPLTQALLITDPGSLQRYAGLSATLHAGVAIGCWHLLAHRQGAARAVGAAMLAAVGIKLALEMPGLQAWWHQVPVTALPRTELAGAPGHQLAGHAHGCGVAAGLAAAWWLDGIMALRRARRAGPDSAR